MLLPTADEAEITKLLSAVGSKVDSVNVKDCKTSDIIRIHTVTGNRYLLEVSDPANRLAHVYRHERRGGAPNGYRGQRVIISLKVGNTMLYTESDNPENAKDIRKVRPTSLVKSIYLLRA